MTFSKDYITSIERLYCFSNCQDICMPKILRGILLLILVLLFSCAVKHDSIGPLDEIIVFADSLDWPDYEDGLNDLFEKEYLTPVAEKQYILTWKPAREIEKYKNRKNVMFIARLDSRLPVSRQVKELLNKQVIAGIESGKYFYIPQSDTWAQNQYIVFLVAPTRDDMIRQIYDTGELVYDDLQKSYYKRLRERMYTNNENRKLEDYLANNFPFSLLAQKDYVVVDESLEYRYVWMRRLHPDRSIFVHWIPYHDSIKIDFNWIVKQRNELAKRIYHGDIVVEEETHLELFKFKQWKAAYRLEGTWMNPKLVIGGPFRNITFVDKESGLIYMIDFYVQAIGQRKRLYLDQLDIIAHTFRTRSQLAAG